MNRNLKKIRNLLLLFVALLSIQSCGPRKATSKSNQKPVITVTIEPQRYFTEAIAGDKFEVISMVPKGMNPETYDLSPQQLVALSESRAYLRIGYIGFEQNWMKRLISNAPHLQMFDTSEGINLLLGETACGHTHHHQEKGTHSHDKVIEPHIWNSASNALVIARNTYQALCRLDKSNEAYYADRYRTLCNKITETDSLVRKLLATPQSSRAFMIYHPALSYYANDYGLHQFSIEEDGKEPTPAHLKELIELCRTEGIRVLFIQPEFDKRHAEIIAEQAGIKVVPINPLSYQWHEEMINVARSLAKP